MNPMESIYSAIGKTPWVAALLAMSLAPGSLAGQIRVIDRVKIAVNDKVLTEREVAEIKSLQANEYKSRFKGKLLEEKLAQLDETITRQLVEDLLLENHAERLNIDISDEKIEERLDTILRRDPAMGQVYTQTQLKSFILKEMLRRRVLNREVDSRIRVTEIDIRAACRGQEGNAREVEVGHILLRADEPGVREKLLSFRKQLEAGANFEELASKYSQDPSVSGNKGRLGYISRGQFVKPFEEKAFSLPIGGMSDPVRTKFGWHLIKVFGERIKGKLDCSKLDDVARKSFRNQVYSKRRKARMTAFFERLRKKADIRIVN